MTALIDGIAERYAPGDSVTAVNMRKVLIEALTEYESARAKDGMVMVPIGVVKFAASVFQESRDSLSDLDGGWVQDKAEECDLVAPVTVIESCGEECECAFFGFPTNCYQNTEAAKTMIDVARMQAKGE